MKRDKTPVPHNGILEKTKSFDDKLKSNNPVLQTLDSVDPSISTIDTSKTP